MQQQHKGGEDADKEYVDELKPGTQLLQGQYTIDRFLNSGGFGITYLAKDSLDRQIVIKECFPGSFCRRSQAIVAARSRAHQNEFRSVVKLFMQEARSLAKLVHPNIVGVHQVFEDNETAYMAIDYIDGRDLLDMIEDPAVTVSKDQIIEITKKLLSAIAFIHENDVLHRDISPDNILIQKDGEPILIDFGAAREQATKASRALSALRVVKDGYSPQEFYVAGSQQGPWSDLYALAASLYHLIKNEAPINSQVRLASVAEGRGDPYVPLADSGIDGYPKGFLEAIDKAMQTVPVHRLQSAQEWLEMFDPRSSGEKVVPLKVERSDAAKAAAAAITKPQSPAPKAAPAAKPAEPAASGGGSKKMVLMGTAAAIAVVAGIGAFLMGGSTDEVEVAAPPTVLSTPETAPTETASTTPEATSTTPAAPAAAAPATTTAAPSSATPPARQTATAPRVTTPAPATPSAPTTTRPSGTSFADIIATQQGPTTQRPATIAPRSSTTTPTTTARTAAPATTAPAPTTSSASQGSSSAVTFADIIGSRPATTTARPTVAPRTTPSRPATTPRTTTTATPVAPAPVARTTTSTSSRNNSFTDFLAARTDTAAPNARAQATTPRAATVATPVSVTSSEWDVTLPFEATITTRGDSKVAVVSKINDSDAASGAGGWIAEGVEIHQINGAPVDADLNEVFGGDLTVNSNGAINTSVKIKRAGAVAIVDETISIAGTRVVTLSNGTVFETKRISGDWVTQVTNPGRDQGSLRAGDILLHERSTDTALDQAMSVERLLGSLISNNTRIAQFSVRRGNSRAVANVALN